MFILFAFLVIAYVFLLLVISAATIGIWIAISTLSAAFSRIPTALMIGALINFSLFEGNFLTWILFSVLSFVAIMFLSKVPRINLAISFSSTCLVTGIAAFLTYGIGSVLIKTIFKTDDTNLLWAKILCIIVVLFAAAFNWIRDVRKVKDPIKGPAFLNGKAVVIISRIVSTILYAITFLVILAISFEAINYILGSSPIVLIASFVGVSGLLYTADLFLFDRAA